MVMGEIIQLNSELGSKKCPIQQPCRHGTLIAEVGADEFLEVAALFALGLGAGAALGEDLWQGSAWRKKARVCRRAFRMTTLEATRLPSRRGEAMPHAGHIEQPGRTMPPWREMLKCCPEMTSRQTVVPIVTDQRSSLD